MPEMTLRRLASVNDLTGKFFHTFRDDGTVVWQGHVTGSLGNGLLVVELFSWVSGDRSDEIIVRIDDLITQLNGSTRFAIYDSAEIMNDCYQSEFKHRQGRSDA